ncbi:Putative aliphatic sulfonates-binding protein [Klebsiella pneumoniae]|nr:Putative aliphatic sulfonates-binding protein [Klebsiella pneumoniae]
MRAPPSSRATTHHLGSYSAALLQGGARVLTDGTDLKQTGSFYLASRPYAERNGAFIEGVLDTFTQADALTHSQRAQSITLLAKTMAYRRR